MDASPTFEILRLNNARLSQCEDLAEDTHCIAVRVDATCTGLERDMERGFAAVNAKLDQILERLGPLFDDFAEYKRHTDERIKALNKRLEIQ